MIWSWSDSVGRISPYEIRISREVRTTDEVFSHDPQFLADTSVGALASHRTSLTEYPRSEHVRGNRCGRTPDPDLPTHTHPSIDVFWRRVWVGGSRKVVRRGKPRKPRIQTILSKTGARSYFGVQSLVVSVSSSSSFLEHEHTHPSIDVFDVFVSASAIVWCRLFKRSSPLVLIPSKSPVLTLLCTLSVFIPLVETSAPPVPVQMEHIDRGVCVSMLTNTLRERVPLLVNTLG